MRRFLRTATVLEDDPWHLVNAATALRNWVDASSKLGWYKVFVYIQKKKEYFKKIQIRKHQVNFMVWNCFFPLNAGKSRKQIRMVLPLQLHAHFGWILTQCVLLVWSPTLLGVLVRFHSFPPLNSSMLTWGDSQINIKQLPNNLVAHTTKWILRYLEIFLGHIAPNTKEGNPHPLI